MQSLNTHQLLDSWLQDGEEQLQPLVPPRHDVRFGGQVQPPLG